MSTFDSFKAHAKWGKNQVHCLWPVPFLSQKLSSFEPLQYLPLEWVTKRSSIHVLLASLSVDSKKLCCQDRMGIGVRNNLVVVCPWMLRTSWQGDSLILLWRCPNQTNRQKRLKVGIYEQTVWVRNNMWTGARMPVIIASASTEAACQATIAFGCKGLTSPPAHTHLDNPYSWEENIMKRTSSVFKKFHWGCFHVCLYVCLFV